MISNFFSDIKNFISFKSVLGVDIGTTSIKIAEVTRRGERLYLDNYGILSTHEYLERGNAAIQTSAFSPSVKDLSGLLGLAVANMKPKTKKVIASVPVFSSFVTTFEMPLISKKETESAVSFNARQFIPLPLEKVSLEWEKADEYEREGRRFQQILITAIPNDIIGDYKKAFSKAGLRLSALELENQSLARLAGREFREPIMIIDIGAESTNILAFDEGLIKKSFQTDYGGGALTKALARTTGLSPRRAEDLKQRLGLLGTMENKELSTSLIPFLDVIIREVQQARGNFKKVLRKDIKKAALTGGGAKLKGMNDYVKKVLDMEIVEINSLGGFRYPGSVEPIVSSLNKELAIACGLALKFHLSQ